MVQVPSLEDMLGDKLTAFAPHTTDTSPSSSVTAAWMKIFFSIFAFGTSAPVAARIWKEGYNKKKPGFITST